MAAIDGDAGPWGRLTYSIAGDGIPTQRTGADGLGELNAEDQKHEEDSNESHARMSSSARWRRQSDAAISLNNSYDLFVTPKYNVRSARIQSALDLLESEVYNSARPNYTRLPAFAVHPHSGTVYALKVRPNSQARSTPSR